MQNRLHKQTSQQKKLVNNGKLPKFTNNIVDLDLYRAEHYHKPVSQDAWKSYHSFFITHNISPSDAHIIVCILELQRRNKPTYHLAIAKYTGLSEKTIQRSLVSADRSGLISYTPGRNARGSKLPSRITFVIKLPPLKALKSYARLKKRNREIIDNFDKQEIARRVKKARERHAMKDIINTEQKQNVHLINNKTSLLKNTIVNDSKSLKKKLVTFSLQQKHFDHAKNFWLIESYQVIRMVEKWTKQGMLNGVKTEEMWDQYIYSLFKLGRIRGWDFTAKEMKWYNDEKQKQVNNETNKLLYLKLKQQTYEKALSNTSYELTFDGVCRMIAEAYGKEELEIFTGWIVDVRYDDTNKWVIFLQKYANYIGIRPKWENAIRKYYNYLEGFVYDCST